MSLREYDIIRRALSSGAYNAITCVIEEEDDSSDEDDLFVNHCPEWTAVGGVGNHDFGNRLTKTIFSYPRCDDITSVASSPIYPGSPFTLQDLCRYLLYLKSRNSVIGDRLMASWLGVISAFLPADNALASLLKGTPSMYTSLKICQNLADLPQDLTSFVVDVCQNRTVAMLFGKSQKTFHSVLVAIVADGRSVNVYVFTTTLVEGSAHTNRFRVAHFFI
jgi:hypothetical protein